jgi:HYR domain-containing protein
MRRHPLTRAGVAVAPIAAAIVGLALTAAAPAAMHAVKDTLTLNGVFKVSNGALPCPAGSPASVACYQFRGKGSIPGLGQVTEEYVASMDESNPACALLGFTPDVLTVVGKGEIDLSITVSARCNGFPTGFTVTGGSGAYAGASGSGSFTPNLVKNGAWQDPEGSSDDDYVDKDDMGGWVSDRLAGNVGVPNLTFDMKPPVIGGAVSKTVHLAVGVTRARVRFNITAHDAVDGSVPVTCSPRSGSFFKIGRTKVTCSSSDSSANRASARFTISVKRAIH